MNCCHVHGAGLSLLCLCTLGAGREPPDAANKPIPSHAQVQKWIAELGDDSFEVREAATRNLTEAWQQSLPAVAEAVKSADPEVRQRAGDIIKRIDANAAAKFEALGAVLSFDNDKSVVVVSYFSGADAKKAAHMRDDDRESSGFFKTRKCSAERNQNWKPRSRVSWEDKDTQVSPT